MLPFVLGRGRLLRSLVLTMLSRKSMTGMEIMRELERLSMGLWRPSPGTIYPLLKALEREGLVVRKDEGGRKVYELTSEGRALAREYAFLIPARGVEEVVNAIEAYVDYLYDYSREEGLSREVRERIRRIASLLERLGEGDG